MNVIRFAVTCAAPLGLFATTLSAPVLAQSSTPTQFERAMLAQLDSSTRAAVESRAVSGNTVMNVVGTILLNNYYQAGARNPGQALTVVAVDFSRGVVVLRREPNFFEIERFDPQTLRILR